MADQLRTWRVSCGDLAGVTPTNDMSDGPGISMGYPMETLAAISKETLQVFGFPACGNDSLGRKPKFKLRHAPARA